ncbi:MAG: ABC transporter permease [Planctomycetota bacterium]|nr:ABC transporter permease [Planctomycetota bacterium]
MDDVLLFLAATLRIGSPVLLAAMGEAVLERSGVLNIGIEGVMLAGAFAGFVTAWSTGSPLLGAGASMLAGALVAAVLAFMVLRVKADQIVSGMALNLVAMGLTGSAYRALENHVRAGGGSTDLRAPTFAPILFEQTALTWFAFLSVPAIWFYLERSERGLELRAVGEHPGAAQASGVDVAACRFKAALAAGAFAGLGGAFLTISQTASFSSHCTNGRGFVALAAVVLGRYSAWGTAAACVFFGAAFAARDRFQASGLNVHPEILEMLPYLLTLFALVFALRRRTGAPAALGKPF